MARNGRSDFLALLDLENGSRPTYFDFDIPPLTTDVSAMLSYKRPSTQPSKSQNPTPTESAQSNALDALSFAASQAASSSDFQNSMGLESGSIAKIQPLQRKLVAIRPRLKDREFPEPKSGPARKPRRRCSVCNGYFGNLSTHKSVHTPKDSLPYSCFVCRRKFSRPTDLTRHQQSHQTAVYKCPLFVDQDLKESDRSVWNLAPGCHQDGCFSRRDTYKNHLKAMHFEYPPGTRRQDRSASRGKCKACGKTFENPDIWISCHINTGSCGGIKTAASIRPQSS